MVFPNIEKIKQEYTNQFVVVDPERPELARFADYTGVVKTVNMSGRALVEFLDYHTNIGWYDIDLDYLKVVDKPVVREKKAAPQPEAKAGKKPAAKAAGGKPSTADILAKLRGGGGAPAPEAAKSADKPAPAKAPAATSGKVDKSSMTVEEMIAYCREHDAS